MTDSTSPNAASAAAGNDGPNDDQNGPNEGPDDDNGAAGHESTTSPPADDEATRSDTDSHPGPDPHPEQGSADGDDESSTSTPDSHQVAQRRTRPRGQLASLPAGAPRPPRRTGIFVDPQDLRSHVSDLLRAIVGSHGVDSFGNFTFDHESARVFVTVSGSPVGPIVGVFAVTNTKLSLTPQLADWMARTNHRLLLGTLSWDDDNDAVWLRHNLLGSHLDAAELQAAVGAVATTAVQVATDVHEKFGGTQFTSDESTASSMTQPGDSSDDGQNQVADDDGEDGMANATGYL